MAACARALALLPFLSALVLASPLPAQDGSRTQAKLTVRVVVVDPCSEGQSRCASGAMADARPDGDASPPPLRVSEERTAARRYRVVEY